MRGVLITGAARRVGACIARDLGARGWRVIVHYHRSAEDALALCREIEADGGTAVALGADLADPAAASGLIDRAFVVAPDVELLVNNASDFTFDDAMTATPEALHASFAINAVAPIVLSQRFAALLPGDRGGAIVNILDNRVGAPNPDYFSYGVSKFAALGATRMLALAFAPRVRVNAIAPGITLASGAQTTEEFQAAHQLNPLGRGCSPEEIAAAVHLAATSPAMTGTVITIDGGLTLANPGRDVAFVDKGDRR